MKTLANKLPTAKEVAENYKKLFGGMNERPSRKRNGKMFKAVVRGRLLVELYMGEVLFATVKRTPKRWKYINFKNNKK